MSGRGSYLLRKVGWAMITVFVVITFNFVLFRVLPGDPAKSGLRDPRLSPAAVQALRERFGVDKPLFLDLDGEDPFDTQYVAYLVRSRPATSGRATRSATSRSATCSARRWSTPCGWSSRHSSSRSSIGTGLGPVRGVEARAAARRRRR